MKGRRFPKAIRLLRGLGLILFFAFPSGAWAESEEVGVLVLAHGGGPQWNAQVMEAVRQANLPYPTEVAFGMGMDPKEAQEIQRAVWRLEASGVKEIRVIPLLVSSYSSVFRQYEFLLGLKADSSWPEHAVRPIQTRTKVTMSRALDDSPLVAAILLERARKISQDPEGEAVVLVAHGPELDEDNQQWLRAMDTLGEGIGREGRFAQVISATLQDDAPPPVRQVAIERLREQVALLNRSYRVLVVPLLISQNGIEQKIFQAVEGLEFVYSGETLLPHKGISRWIRKQCERGVQ